MKFTKNISTKFIQGLSDSEFVDYIFETIAGKARKMEPKESLKMLFDLDARLYELQGQESIRYGNGVHSKHKHIRYHDFFTSNIKSGESVLDIGSSLGELTSDIADKAASGKVIGIEIEKNNYDRAIQLVNKSNLEFVHGDATKDLPDTKFDVIVLSNVLEHIENRPELLKKLNQKYKPNRFLIRVPLFERDWRVPLKKEIGVDYRLDNTHFIEYTQETFNAETKQAGLKVENMQVRWGEIWAVLSSSKK